MEEEVKKGEIERKKAAMPKVLNMNISTPSLKCEYAIFRSAKPWNVYFVKLFFFLVSIQ